MWKSIGKIINCSVDINKNIMKGCVRVSESVMIGGLGLILARENVFSRFNALALLLHSHEVTGIVHACVGVILFGNH